MITRIILIVVGLGFLVLGGALLWQNIPHDTYLNLGIWLAGGLIAHDLLLAGLVAGGGWFVSKYVPGRVRPYVQSGAIVAGCVIVMSIPVLIAGGRTPSNPSLLPLNYWLNLAIVLGIIALVTAVVAFVRLRRPSAAELGEGASG